MCFASVSCRHLFHGTLENTHRVQPHLNSSTGQEVISVFFFFFRITLVCVCSVGSPVYFSSVKYLTQTASVGPGSSLRSGEHDAFLLLRKMTGPFTTRGVDDCCGGFK